MNGIALSILFSTIFYCVTLVFLAYIRSKPQKEMVSTLRSIIDMYMDIIIKQNPEDK